MKVILRFLFILSIIALSFAAIPIEFNTDDLSGDHEIVFRIYDSQEGGKLIWMEAHREINLDRDLKKLDMGSRIALPSIKTTDEFFVEILIDGSPIGPRESLSSIRAFDRPEDIHRDLSPEESSDIMSPTEEMAIGLTIQGPDGTENTRIMGDVGIGTPAGTDPSGKLDIRGDHVRIWDGSATPGYANVAGDLYVENELEVDGTIYGTNWRSSTGANMLTAGSGISVSEDANGQWTIANTAASGGTVTNIATSAPITGGPISTTGTIGLQQEGDIIAGTNISISGGTDVIPGSDANDVIVNFTGTSGDSDWQVSGSDMYSIPSGDIGIGTSSPSSKLHIAKSVSGIEDLLTIDASGGSSAGSAIKFINSSTVVLGRIKMSPSTVIWDSRMDFDVSWGTGAGDNTFTAMSILGRVSPGGPTGYVGIGTTSPAADLDLNGTLRADHYRDGVGGNLLRAGTGISVSEDGDGSWLVTNTGTGGDSDWQISGSNMYSLPAGNVGIGTPTPTSKLEVQGRTANIGQNNTVTFPSGSYGANIAVGGSIDITGGRGSTVLGWDNSSSGDFGTILGVRNDITSSVSGGHVFGLDNTVSATDAFAIGSFVNNSIAQSLQFGWNSSGAPGSMTIRNTGDIGIGTTSPSAHLHIQNSGGGEIARFSSYSYSGPTAIIGTETNAPGLGYLELWYASEATPRVRITADASDVTYFNAPNNVGIGTNLPTHRLQVVGDEAWIGNAGTASMATGDGDLFVEDVLEVEGGIELNGSYITSWPSGGSSYWTDHGTYLSPAGGEDVYSDGEFYTPSTNGVFHHGTTGLKGAASGWTPDHADVSGGVWLESGASEGGGFYADGNIAAIWAAGDGALLDVYDEDALTSGPRFTIDGAGNVLPGNGDNLRDLGSSTYSWRNVYIDGRIYVDGASTANRYLGTDASGNLAWLTVSSGSSEWYDGGTYLRTNETGESVRPFSDDNADLGATGYEWRNLYIDGTAYLDYLNMDGIINLDNNYIYNSGTSYGYSVAFGDNIVPTSSSYDIGYSTYRWDDIFLGSSSVININGDDGDPDEVLKINSSGYIYWGTDETVGSGGTCESLVENFNSSIWPTGWYRTSSSYVAIETCGYIGSYGLEVEGMAGAYAESPEIDVSGCSSVTFTYYFNEGGNCAGGEEPDSGDILYVQWWNGSSWTTVRTLNGATEYTSWQFSSHSISASNTDFKVRFYYSSGSGDNFDTWHFDQINLTGVSLLRRLEDDEIIEEEVEVDLLTSGDHLVNGNTVYSTEPVPDDRYFAFGVSAEDNILILDGDAKLEGGSCEINFTETFKAFVDPDMPIRVTATPLNESNGIFISESSIDGFTVKENAGGTSNAKFNWMVIGRKKN